MFYKNRSRSASFFIALFITCATGWPQEIPAGSIPDAFIEEGGLVAFEASSYHENTPGNAGHTWVPVVPEGYHGMPPLQAVPDSGTYAHLGAGAPVLSYQIYFQTPGTYGVYLRGSGSQNSSDSVYVALDGKTLLEDVSLGINDFPFGWGWLSEVGDPSQKVTFEITEPGLHDFEILMREDGVLIDDVVISQNTGLTEEALDGISYSPRYGESPPNALPKTQSDSLVILEGGPAVMFDPLANDLDPDGDTMSLIAVGASEYGSAKILDGKAVYTLNKDHAVFSTLNKGVLLFDGFDYVASDDHGGEATGQVSITIVGVSSPGSVEESASLGFSEVELTLDYDPDLDSAAPGAYHYEVRPRGENPSHAHVSLFLSSALIEEIRSGLKPGFSLDLVDRPDSSGEPESESPAPAPAPGFPDDFSFEVTTVETGYRHVKMIWKDDTNWSRPWLIQRSTSPNFVDPVHLIDNQAADNTGRGTFRWLGVNANNYIDIDGLEENTTYYYRLATCENLSKHYQQGVMPKFSSWIYGTATTGSLDPGKKKVYDVTDYGAVAGDGQNDYLAVLDALAAAESAGGGVVYLPAGVYDLWPLDNTVKVIGGIPTLTVGKTATSCMFDVKSDNITFQGDAADAGPSTFLKFYLWQKIPATRYLSIRNTSGQELQVRRYALFQPHNVSDITFKDLDIDMGAIPVNTGKEWYSLEDKKYQWDISHKFFHSNHFIHFKNAVFDNIVCRNGRGELIYNGGGSEKILVKGCELGPSNSSTISGSFDAEIVDTVFRDSANAAVESAIFSNQVSAIDGNFYQQNHIARGCTFIGLDQSDQGVMKNLPGSKSFMGWACFNQEGTYQSVTDSRFKDCVTASFAPWYEYRNGFRFNCEFSEVPGTYAGAVIRTWTSAQSSYKLQGGMSHILWLGDRIHVTKDWANHQPFFYSQPAIAANGNESPWIWEAVHFETSGGAHKINRLWIDIWGNDQGRQDVVFKDWTKSGDLNFDGAKFEFKSLKHIDPEYINFFE